MEFTNNKEQGQSENNMLSDSPIPRLSPERAIRLEDREEGATVKTTPSAQTPTTAWFDYKASGCEEVVLKVRSLLLLLVFGATEPGDWSPTRAQLGKKQSFALTQPGLLPPRQPLQ